MYAELDVFSGRPNPKWNLTASESQELITRFHKLPKAESGRLEDRLGYRGIIVTTADNETDVFDVLTASAGNVYSRGSNGIARWSIDSDHAFERWLLRLSKNRVPAELYELASRELGR